MADFDISIEGMGAFTNALDKSAKITKRTPRKAIVWGWIAFARSARAAARRKFKRHRRDVIPNPAYPQNSRAKFLIVRHLSGGGIRHIPTNKKSDPRRKIANFGLFADSFGWMLKAFGRKSKKQSKLSARRFTSTRKRLTGSNPHADFYSSLTYGFKHAPGLLSEAFGKAGNWMLKQTERYLDRQLRKIWR